MLRLIRSRLDRFSESFYELERAPETLPPTATSTEVFTDASDETIQCPCGTVKKIVDISLWRVNPS